MTELINDILTAPLKSPLLLAISVMYAIVEAIRIYDARLIQAKARGIFSGVALRAEGRFLPRWVGYVHFAGWALLIAILILNWKYAIAFYAFLFILRVLPVLENVGELIMRPFLQTESEDTEIS